MKKETNNKIIYTLKYIMLSALIVIKPSNGDVKISRYLFGNNIEYIYDTEFLKIEKEMTSLSKDVISVLRFPGGGLSDKYFWLDGVRPKSRRELTLSESKGHKNSNLLGTDEIIKFCEQIGAEPIFTVNVKTGTCEEAKNWVEYCNGTYNGKILEEKDVRNIYDKYKRNKMAHEIPKDYFPMLRSFNGMKEPININFWEIGNEIYLDQNINPEQYALKIIEYAQGMKSTDKNIMIGVSFCDFNLKWNNAIMDNSKYFDFICMHFYNGPGSSPIAFNFYSNRSESKENYFEKDGNYILSFEAYGNMYLGYPILEIRVDNKVVKNLEVKSNKFEKYEVEITMTSGKHIISLGFINDICLGKGKDRNLFIRNMFINYGKEKRLLFDNNYEYYVLFNNNYLVENKLKIIKEYLNKYNYKGEIAITEGNVNYGLAGNYDKEQTKHGVKLKSALFVAGLLNSFARENIWMYNYWNLITPGYYGLFRPDGHVIPSYYVMKLYAKYLYENLLDTQINSPLFENKVNMLKINNKNEVSYLDAITTINNEKTKISLMVVNRSSQKDIECTIDMSKYVLDSSMLATERILMDKDGSGMEADNESDPNNVTIMEKRIKIASSIFTYKFLAHTLTNLEIQLVKK